MRILRFLLTPFRRPSTPTDGRPFPLDLETWEISIRMERARKWAELRQRVVEELRRELYGMPTPWHLRIIEAAALVNDENIYDRCYDRWESDVKWCADLFGEDPQDFLRECRQLPQDIKAKLPPLDELDPSETEKS